MNNSRKNFVASAVLLVKEQIDIDITFEKMDAIVGDAMEDEWGNPNYEYTEASASMDTAPREEIFDLVSMFYLGKYWPCYGDKVDFDQFLSDLKQAVLKKV